MGTQCGSEVENNACGQAGAEFSGKEGCRRGKNVIVAVVNSRQVQGT